MLELRCTKHPTYTGKNPPRKQKNGEVCLYCECVHLMKNLEKKHPCEYVDCDDGCTGCGVAGEDNNVL